MILLSMSMSSLLFGVKVVIMKEIMHENDMDIKSIFREKLILLIAAVYLVAALILNRYIENSHILIKSVDLLVTLIILSPVDIKYKKVPDVILILTVISQFTLSIPYIAMKTFVNMMVASTVTLILFWIISRLSSERIGLGDVKLLAVMVFSGGVGYAVNALIYAMVSAFIVSMLLLLTKLIKVKDEIPFVPFLTFGSMIFYIFNYI